MAKDDTPLIEPGDVAGALGLLTRLPISVAADFSDRRGARAAWAWPLVGAVLAALAGIAGAVALGLGLGPALSALIALACLVVVTGAMHEDGLADAADGFWGGFDRDRRLDIMRDSRIGSYGVLALILAMGARWAALSDLAQAGQLFAGLVISATLSRAAMAALMQAVEPARKDGLSAGSGQPGQQAVQLGGAIALVLALLTGGFGALWAVLAVALLAYGMGRLALAKIGGQTGDVLGATQQICEIGALAAVVAMS